jgi:hypothetical protein
MAINNGNKLTKYESATTVVTAAAMNKIYGGLYGTAEGDTLAVTDPLVAGHIHDGQHIDGHAQKVDLVDHVTGQLRNSNLADEAVTHRNVKGFLDQSSAIPEFEVIDGDTYYYLDLSDLRSEIPASVGTGDKSSIVGGEDNLASADRSGVFGGKNNWASGIESVVLGGKDSVAAGQKSSVSGGEANNITSFGDYSFAGGGLSNSISGTKSSILAGESNLLSGSKSTILGGLTNSVSSDKSSIITGQSNILTSLSTFSLIGAGSDNNVAATKSAILTGDQNQIYNGFSTPEKSAILSGSLNEVYNNESAIISGTGNLLGSDKSIIGSGDTNQVYSESSGILSGVENQITGDAAIASIIGGGGKAGSGNLIDLSGLGARLPGAFYGGAFIGGGIENEISGAYADYGVITGGKSNFIDGSGPGTDYAFIGGGQDNEVSGSWGVVTGGFTNTVSADYGTISGGSTNTASGLYSTIGGGISNTASGISGTIGGGSSNTTSGDYSTVAGGAYNKSEGDYSFSSGTGAIATNWGEHNSSSGSFNAMNAFSGDVQKVSATWFNQTTTTATLTEIFLSSTNERYVLKDFSVLSFSIEIAAISSVYDAGGIKISGIIKRGSGAASTAIAGTPIVTVDSDAALSGITAAVSADTTNGSLKLEVQGLVTKTIRWVASMNASLVRYV